MSCRLVGGWLSSSVRILCCLVLLAPLTPRLLWAAGLTIDDTVPVGFESLAGPRLMFVDIIFNDRIAGTAVVTVEGDTLSFDDPQLILDMLDTVEHDVTLLAAMGLPQPTNVERLCYRPGDPAGCGTLEPDPFALLFDEDELKVTVFVDSSLQQVRADTGSRYLNAPLRHDSGILLLEASASSFTGEAWEYDLRGEGWYGYGRGYVRSVLGIDSSARGARLESLALVHRLQDHELLAGTYLFPAGPALSGFNVLGLRMATSMQTRVDTDRARGSKLSVLLDRRAIVRLFVDGRLYSTQSLEAGHVAIDTTDLPDGSMEVEVRIADPLSGERIEYHRFTRSALLPPHDETAMSVAMGAPLQRDSTAALPRLHKAGVGSIRIARRTGERTAAALRFTHLDGVDLLQSELVLLGHNLTLETSISLGLRGERGLGLLGIWNRGPVMASLSGEWFDDGRKLSTVDAAVDSQRPWLPKQTGQLSASLDRLFGRTSLGIQASARQESDLPSSRFSTVFGIGVRHRLYESSRFRSSLSARVRRERGHFDASLNLRVSFGNRSRFTSLLASAASSDLSQLSFSEGSNETSQSVLGIENRWRANPSPQWQFDGGMWVTTGSAGTGAGLDAEVRHEKFGTEIQSQWREQSIAGRQEEGSFDTSLHLSSQLVLDDSGVIFAGNDAVRAGFILDVRGEPAGAEYDILVGRSQVATGRVGTPVFVSLPPFERYDVRLRSHSLLASTIEQETFELTLYPGAISRVITVARERRLLIATLVDVEGNLLSNAVLERDEGPLLIGSDGLLQIETNSDETFELLLADGTTCELVVPTLPADEDIVVLDIPLVCQ